MAFRSSKMLVSLLLASLLSAAASAQTLAHKGWAGSGITIAPWWQGAVLYQIDPLSFQDSNGDGFGDLRGIVQRLDYLQSLSVDAVVLSPLQLQPQFRKSGVGVPFDERDGSEEDLDQLVQEASRHRIRVFVDLPLNSSRSVAELEGEARFWLSRGIAGLRLIGGPPGSDAALTTAQLAERVHALQRVCASYAGQRVLFWDLPQPIAEATPARRRVPAASAVAAPELLIDPRLQTMAHLNPTELRSALVPANATMTPAMVPTSDSNRLARSLDRYSDGAHDIALAKIVAAALLTSQGAPLLYFGQEIGMATSPDAAAKNPDPAPMPWGGETGFTTGVPWMAISRNASSANVALEDADAGSLLNWYRTLSALHHQNVALHSGSMAMIADGNPDIVAWIRQIPASAATDAPVLVVCNLTAQTLLVSVAADVRRLGIVTGTGLMRTLASTQPSSGTASPGAVSMNSIALPPFGIYIGELPRQPGLESVPSPLKHSLGSRASP
jgi:hypothetical protein